MNIKAKILLSFVLSAASSSYADVGFIVGYVNGEIYSFDPSDPSIPASPIFTELVSPDCIGFSPDGSTVYVTSNQSEGSIYFFNAAGPYTSVDTIDLVDAIYPVSVAILADGQNGVISTDSNGLYSFPLGGSDHTAVALTPTATVLSPLSIVLNGNTAYISDYPTGGVYSVTFDIGAAQYTATAIASLSGLTSAGLAISSDGYLYITNTFGGQVYRISLSDLGGSPTLVATPPGGVGYADGITVTSDGKTVYVASVDNGIYTFPTDEGFPQTYAPTSLGVTSMYDLGIPNFSSSPSIRSFKRPNNRRAP